MTEPTDSDPLPTQPWSGPGGSFPTPGGSPVPEPRRGGWQPPEPEHLQASFPQYEIRGVLGHGGMGAVYQGWQKSLRRLVAIKILPPGLEDHGANFAERFQREAQAMARFSHPGIVSVYDAGETADGLFYFVMEYIEGTDVQQMVKTQGPLPPEHALSITAHVCDALAYAHKRGVIHRDIKPANIMVDAEGQVKVADFGLAKVANDDSAALVTGTHVSMGTADFMAPEALYGMSAVDHRADLYAVGVMLYQMLTGEVPRGRFDLPSIARPGLDARFDAIVDRAMQKNPEKRYASATEIRADLDQILTTPLLHCSAAQQAPPPAPLHTESPTPLGQRKVSDSEAWASWQPAPAALGASPKTPTSKPPAKSLPAPGAPPRRSRRWVWLSSAVAATVALFAAGSIFFHKDTTDSSTRPEAASVPLSAAEEERLKAAIPPLPVAEPSASGPRQTIDLLALVSLTDDRINAPGYTEANRWTKSAGKLVYESDGKMGKLVPPVAMNTRDYEIEFAFRRIAARGGERLIIDLPIDGAPTSLPLILNSPGEKFIHNQQGDLWPGPARDRGRFVVRCQMGRVAGETDRVIVSLDGKTLTDWRGSLRASSKATEAHPSFPRQLLTSLVCRRDGYEFTKWELRVFEGEAKVLRNPPASAVDATPAAASKDAPLAEPAERRDRVMRGRAFNDGERGPLLSSNRYRRPPADRWETGGFRVVLALSPVVPP